MPRSRRTTAVLALLIALCAALLSAPSASAATSAMTDTEASYAKSVLTQLNQQRADHQLPALHSHPALVRSAYQHDRTMAKDDDPSHQAKGERSFTDREYAAGYKHRCAAGENVGVNGNMDRQAARTLQTMMYREKAPNDGHRKNILNRRYTDVGVAVLLDTVHHRLWLTVDFGTDHC